MVAVGVGWRLTGDLVCGCCGSGVAGDWRSSQRLLWGWGWRLTGDLVCGCCGSGVALDWRSCVRLCGSGA